MNDPSASPPSPWIADLRGLLAAPTDPEATPRPPLPTAGAIGRQISIALLSLLAYGAAAGLFQGGRQIVESALKAPLVVALALLLCAPSLYIFSSLAGAVWDGRRLAAALASFSALCGLVLLGLLPVAWLFSVSSRYLGFVSLVHVGCWLVATALAGRTLAHTLRPTGSGARLWTALLFVVSLQAATYLSPLLWRQPGEAWRSPAKKFFLEHYLDAARLRQGESPAPAP